LGDYRFATEAQRALDTATARGAQYADVRFEDGRSETIEVRNGVVNTLADERSCGYGIRAFFNGAWGFAASDAIGDAGIDATAARAVAIARAGAAVAALRFGEAPTERYVDVYATPVEIDPATIPVGERVAFLLEVEKAMHVTKRVTSARAGIEVWRTYKEFYSTTGSQIAQTLYQSGSAIEALAVGDGEAQERTFPGDIGLYQTGGWEIVRAAALRENAQRIGEEADRLLTAPQCPSEVTDVILGGSQVSLQIHESCGHAAELDRIMGWEANFSGTSFLDPTQRGKLRYGSSLVTIELDNTLPLGLATVGYDDEGSRSVRSDIVRDGLLAGFEMSRDTARTLGLKTNACVRAELARRADDPHVQSQPAAGRSPLRRAIRRRKTWCVYGVQSFLVDRRSSAQLPVRLPDRLGDPQRKARPDAQEPDVCRRDAAVLELVRRHRRPELVGCLGDAVVRQGRALAGRADHAGCRARTFSECRRRRRLRWIVPSARRWRSGRSRSPEAVRWRSRFATKTARSPALRTTQSTRTSQIVERPSTSASSATAEPGRP
jgi:TldD protein